MANGDPDSAVTADVVERVREAHSRWEADCLALDLRLADVGLPFGASGYKLAVERGVHRLVEGVTLALIHVRKNVSHRGPAWMLAHQAILDAVDQLFLASSRLIAMPAADPVLEVASRGVRYQVMRHREQTVGNWWMRRVAAPVQRLRQMMISLA